MSDHLKSLRFDPDRPLARGAVREDGDIGLVACVKAVACWLTRIANHLLKTIIKEVR